MVKVEAALKSALAIYILALIAVFECDLIVSSIVYNAWAARGLVTPLIRRGLKLSTIDGTQSLYS